MTAGRRRGGEKEEQPFTLNGPTTTTTGADATITTTARIDAMLELHVTSF